MSDTISTVGVIAISEGKVLLVKHTKKAAHLTDTYGLPAGRVEEAEEAITGAIRELEEETGLIVTREDLIHLPTIYEADIPRKNGEIAHMKWDVFAATKFTGSIRDSEETIPEWVELLEVSKLNLLPNTQNAIAEGLQLLDLA